MGSGASTAQELEAFKHLEEQYTSKKGEGMSDQELASHLKKEWLSKLSPEALAEFQVSAENSAKFDEALKKSEPDAAAPEATTAEAPVRLEGEAEKASVPVTSAEAPNRLQGNSEASDIAPTAEKKPERRASGEFRVSAEASKKLDDAVAAA